MVLVVVFVALGVVFLVLVAVVACYYVSYHYNHPQDHPNQHQDHKNHHQDHKKVKLIFEHKTQYKTVYIGICVKTPNPFKISVRRTLLTGGGY